MRYGPAEKRPNPTPPILTSKGENHCLTRVLVFVFVEGATLSFRIYGDVLEDLPFYFSTFPLSFVTFRC